MPTEIKYRNIVKPCNNVQDMADALLAIYNLVTAADELSVGDAVEDIKAYFEQQGEYDHDEA
jgi:hypothetical protein